MMPSFDLQALLPYVRKASEAILAVYRTEFEHTLKADRSPLTEADKRSHQILLEGLHAVAPGIPVVSEEAAQIPYAVRRQWEDYFLVDPLDGTREFVEKIPEFAINIALIHKQRPVFGLIHSPNENLTYIAEKGGGAFLAGSPDIRLPRFLLEERVTRVFLSRTDSSSQLDGLMQRIRNHLVTRCGSSLKFCRIAEGAGDFYPRLKGSMEWDTASGAILVEEAGGLMCDLKSQPILYNREDPLNPPFFCMSRSFLQNNPNWKGLPIGL
jgi:3'(2'), 5'-bisphosphate nucleotidase